ncbi:M20 family metallopeptidase [Paenibacillus cymbidii]|uniref:M20 family metallopeptidase n=1 Tax=Paenibacillus cymbidii TaxID=1639034 RepID=UPI0010806AC1|nr:M20 family metallopeptidase [Paenibacillus cymbidii]
MNDYLALVSKQRLADVLRELVRIPSVNPAFSGGQGEAGVADYVKRHLRALGLDVIVLPVEPGRENVIGVLPGAGNGNLLLEAHMDTVQTDGMTVPPFAGEVRNGRLYGRGACDTKASLAAMLIAVEAMKTNGLVPPLGIHLAAVVDEEATYKGVTVLADAVAKGRFVYEGAIVGEPTQLHVIMAHKGCVRFHIDVFGVACHSSHPSGGINAIEQACEVVAFLQRHAADVYPRLAHPIVGSPTHSVTMIEGGVAPNTVPDLCRITIDRRTVPGEEAIAVWQSMKRLLEGLQDADGPLKLAVHEPFLIDHSMEVQPESALVRHMRSAVGRYAPHGRIMGAPYGSDASKLVRAGVPSLVFGPGNLAQAHTRDEWVDLDEATTAAAIIMELAMQFRPSGS